jgi:uncharacterized protein
MEQKKIDKEEIIFFLKNNKPFLAKEFGVSKIALFGSYARGEETFESDIDLLIDTGDFSFKTYCALKAFLEQHFKKNVDVIFLKGMKTFIRRMIEEEIIYA